jgi:DNA-binding transcriptional regulator GbsR (MarR family)
MNIEELIYPQTRYLVLRTLYYANSPITLSEVTDRSAIVLGSVQTALGWLVKKKIISKKIVDRKKLYWISNKTAYTILDKLIKLIDSIKIEQNSERYQFKAKKLFSDIEETFLLVSVGRKSFKK